MRPTMRHRIARRALRRKTVRTTMCRRTVRSTVRATVRRAGRRCGRWLRRWDDSYTLIVLSAVLVVVLAGATLTRGCGPDHPPHHRAPHRPSPPYPSASPR